MPYKPLYRLNRDLVRRHILKSKNKRLCTVATTSYQPQLAINSASQSGGHGAGRSVLMQLEANPL